jgi:hypothetical protein
MGFGRGLSDRLKGGEQLVVFVLGCEFNVFDSYAVRHEIAGTILKKLCDQEIPVYPVSEQIQQRADRLLDLVERIGLRNFPRSRPRL